MSHMVGGFSGLMGAMIIGPRKVLLYEISSSIFEGTIVPHSVAFQVMGVFLLFFVILNVSPGTQFSLLGMVWV